MMHHRFCRKRNLFLVLFSSLVALTLIYTGCSVTRNADEKVARQYCSSCHLFPEPDLLTRESWDYLLTYMGFHLGVRDYSYLQGSPRVVLDNIRSKEMVLVATGTFPQQPLISDKDWKTIREYYRENAPEKPIPSNYPKHIIEELPQFNVRFPDYQPLGAVVTMVRVNEKEGGIMLANNKTLSLTFLDAELKTTNTFSGYELIVDAHQKNDSLMLLSIGDLMGRNVGEGKGYILLSKGNAVSLERAAYIKAGLRRPAAMEFADLDNDGKDEILVCNFGDVSGSLEILSLDETGQYQRSKLLAHRPGIVKTSVYDFDKDGLKDVAVLMGDARENVTIFYNKGNLNFEQRQVIEFNSAYGSTFFELVDFNKDGFMDILTVNGDSDADPYNTLKRYHGIRIFINDGKNSFSQTFFYPMYGVHFARAVDFDQDGDLDIAALSFFPDFSSDKPEVFIYLENTGDYVFRLHTTPLAAGSRWMVMDVGDVDQDGDTDIVLGAAYLPLGMTARFAEHFETLSKSGKAIMILENTLRSK